LSRAQDIIRLLALAPHPERGAFVESYRAATLVPTAAGPRSASTAIYFLLTDEQRATYLHRLRSDELFHLYEGGPLDVLLLPPQGSGRVLRLGLDLAAGERPQIAIPAGTWFGTELPAGVPYCLWGCTVAPGFYFADFELAEGPELAARYPEHAPRIARMTRAGSRMTTVP
jgi:predicted cupin superfamily sugar epimerase